MPLLQVGSYHLLWICEEIAVLKAKCYQNGKNKGEIPPKWGFTISEIIFYGNIDVLRFLQYSSAQDWKFLADMQIW